MSRESEFQGELALIGAGAVATSLASTLVRAPGTLGPVVAVSHRVASRISNALHAGTPAPDPSILRNYSVILVNSPPGQMKALADKMASSDITWRGKCLIFVDCEPGPMQQGPMSAASIAWIRQCPMPGRLAVGGDAGALTAAIRLASIEDRRPIVVPDEVKFRFEAAMLLGGAGFTPIVDSVAHIFRETGMPDKQAARAAVALFDNAVQSYARSGRQSWEWHIHSPNVESVQSQITSLGETEGSLLRALLLFGFGRFQRHPAAAAKLRDHIGE